MSYSTRSDCSEAREHLASHGGRDVVSMHPHLSGCDACTAFAWRLSELNADLRALGDVDAPPPGLTERLLERLELVADGRPLSAAAGPCFSRPLPNARDRHGAIWSAALHAACVFVAVAVASESKLGLEEPPAEALALFFDNWSGLGGGGGGGGDHGPQAAAGDTRAREHRAGRVAPQIPRALALDELEPLEIAHDRHTLPTTVFAPEATAFPGWGERVPGGLAARSPVLSSGRGGGGGGGAGTGVGPGTGWGVGPGSGGGSGGGGYGPGDWDREPVLRYQPPSPPYPSKAQARNITGEVMLRIRVRTDGTTEVLNVLKSLPHCVEVAKQSAMRYRWLPAMKDGHPVAAIGIITVRFELVR